MTTSTNYPETAKGKILIMDDEPLIIEVTSEILVYFGYQVESVENGEQAVNLYKQAMQNDEPFDAVILDLKISGGMGGRKTIRMLKSLDPNVKAILSTGNSDPDDHKDYESMGFAALLQKPYEMEILSETLKTLLV